jgi:hypothetical protein
VDIFLQLHGSLMTGSWLGDDGYYGDRFIEIVACWSIVLLVTGTCGDRAESGEAYAECWCRGSICGASASCGATCTPSPASCSRSSPCSSW